MKESYGEGLASHSGPESCVACRKIRGEALTRVHMGQVLSFERDIFWVPTFFPYTEGNIRGVAKQDTEEPGGVVDPVHVWKHHTWELGDPAAVYRQIGVDCIEKSKDVSQ